VIVIGGAALCAVGCVIVVVGVLRRRRRPLGDPLRPGLFEDGPLTILVGVLVVVAAVFAMIKG
jgi:hypothetical protein